MSATDRINAMIDSIPDGATQEEIDAVMLQAFGIFAADEIPNMGIPQDAADTLMEAFAPFAQGETK